MDTPEDIVWDRVESVAATGESPVMYDICVDEDHNFTANGMVVHNSWTGSSVSLRVLENHFLTDRELIDSFLNEFLLPNLMRYFRLPKIRLKQRDFKMADDVQQKQLAMQLNQLGKISDTTLLGQSGFDFEDELLLRKSEQIQLIELQRKTLIQQAELSGMTQVVGAKYQAVANLEVARANNVAQVEVDIGRRIRIGRREDDPPRNNVLQADRFVGLSEDL